jgi:hypothetical protein
VALHSKSTIKLMLTSKYYMPTHLGVVRAMVTLG